MMGAMVEGSVTRGTVYRRAARAVWIAGGFVLLLSGCCVTSVGISSQLPADEFAKAVDPAGRISPTVLPQLQSMMLTVAVTIGVLTVLPAAVLMWLGFGVRDGRSRSLYHARWIVIVLLCLSAASTVVMLAVVLGQGPGGVVQVLLHGGKPALLFRALLGVRAAQAVAEVSGGEVGDPGEDEDDWDRDPWEPQA